MLRAARQEARRLRVWLTDTDGEPAEGLDVAVEIRDRAGTLVQAGAAAEGAGEPGSYTFVAAPRAALGLLDVAWTATIDGHVTTVNTWYEVVGSHVTTVARLRRRHPLENSGKYPGWALELGRDLATYALEDACGVGFARRRHEHTAFDTHVMGALALPHARDIAVVSAEVNDVPLDADGLALIRAGRGGYVTRDYGGFGNRATLTYEHGYANAPPRVAGAVERLAAEWLQEEIDDGIPDRAISVSSDAGTMQLVTAGTFGNLFDIPEVNAVVQAYRE